MKTKPKTETMKTEMKTEIMKTEMKTKIKTPAGLLFEPYVFERNTSNAKRNTARLNLPPKQASRPRSKLHQSGPV